MKPQTFFAFCSIPLAITIFLCLPFITIMYLAGASNIYKNLATAIDASLDDNCVEEITKH
jgi:hypothetical protein